MISCPISFDHLHSLGACQNSDGKVVLFIIPLMLGTTGSGPFIKTQNFVKVICNSVFLGHDNFLFLVIRSRVESIRFF